MLREQLLSMQHQIWALDQAVTAALLALDAMKTEPAPSQQNGCAHERTLDVGTMNEPGKRYCPACQTFMGELVKEGPTHG